MASAQETNVEAEKNDKKLQDIFLTGWRIFEELEESSLPFNSAEYQDKVKAAMGSFENATRIVSQVGVFSANEFIEEVSTESLQYMLLPFFLGKLAMKLNREDRQEVLHVAEVYYKDYLQRCQEYELCEAPKRDIVPSTDTPGDNADNGGANEMAQLLRAAHSRNDKITQYRRKKELEESIKLMKEAVKNDAVDDEVKREFFMKFLKKGIIDANEELDSINLEKQMVEMRRLHMSSGTQPAGALANGGINSADSHGHRHAHAHGHHAAAVPKPKPLQPFIITRNATQKAVFGMGYPSLPVLTVDEFYNQRVQEGIFPDEEKVAKMNQAQAVAAAQDPNEKEDMEQAVVEQQVEDDDPEYLERMRRMDEYKDVVRRGDGNRHNRS